jgi:hypothetical protein
MNAVAKRDRISPQGLCPSHASLLRLTICSHLRPSQPENILNVFQRTPSLSVICNDIGCALAEVIDGGLFKFGNVYLEERPESPSHRHSSRFLHALAYRSPNARTRGGCSIAREQFGPDRF